MTVEDAAADALADNLYAILDRESAETLRMIRELRPDGWLGRMIAAHQALSGASLSPLDEQGSRDR